MAKWNIDPAHTEIGFKVKHLVISTVSGKFASFKGEVTADKEDFTDAKISFSADIASITTGNEQRDGHLKSPDFFDAANYPQLTFESTKIEKKGTNEYSVTGDLTIRGTKRPIVLDAEYGGVQTDFYGNTVAGFEMTGKLNRKDFGLLWHGVTEAGSIVVSDEVKLAIAAEIVKQK
jgi:polyisoprenoid-binding protein YceI